MLTHGSDYKTPPCLHRPTFISPPNNWRMPNNCGLMFVNKCSMACSAGDETSLYPAQTDFLPSVTTRNSTNILITNPAGPGWTWATYWPQPVNLTS